MTWVTISAAPQRIHPIGEDARESLLVLHSRYGIEVAAGRRSCTTQVRSGLHESLWEERHGGNRARGFRASVIRVGQIQMTPTALAN